ncbi:MAG: transglutaminase domain-containing protein, partial [Candidatus Thorarchaeota archaeon]
DEILGAGINKKRVIGVILVAILLISAFAFSTVFISFLFGSQRLDPNERKEGTEYEEALLVAPPYPFDEDFWQDLLDQINPEDIPELLAMLSEMFDGDIDDLDLGNFSEGLLNLLFTGAGEREVFRVYNYLDFAAMSDVLWKYESFDQYNGTGWTSTATSDIYSFFPYGEYFSKYSPDPELLKIKMPMSPNIGANSLVIPSLFPTPNIMENSVSAPNLIPGSTTLYKTDFNSTTLKLSFSSDVDVNMTYEMFGFHLPSALEINNTAIKANYTPAPIQAKYLQLPPDIDTYLLNNPYFANDTNNINATINETDNAFEVADKIRIYLQTQFSFPISIDDYNPAPDGRDVVDWFCETRKGIWSDFASAFCAFTRALGVSSRYIDGFNSLFIEEFFDNDEGQNGFAIKYKNLYNWAEIYVPTDTSGAGNWTQIDIFDSFAGGGNPLLGGNYSINVFPDKLIVNRPDIVNITAVMNSSNGDPIDNNRLTFTDLTTGYIIGSAFTDSFGLASRLYNLNNSHVVGPHIIEARYDFFTAGANITTILGNIGVNLTTVNPQVVNRSDALPDTINVQGVLYDPLNGERVAKASINMLLFRFGTSIQEVGAFAPSTVTTDSNGFFNGNLDINPTVSAGQYEVRADFNGTWMLYGFPFFVPIINDSSNRIGLNLTTALTGWFFIDGVPTFNPNSPSVSRYQILNLTTRVVLEGFGSVPNQLVYFYDYTRGGVQIGTATSDGNGFASYNYTIGDYSLIGPNLLYSKVGPQLNYSYYILNEEPAIKAISGPTPLVINRTGMGATQFNIVGDITDSVNTSRPLSYSEITLKLIRGGTDYSSFLVPVEGYPYQTDITGSFDLTFGVLPNTPPGNYSLRLDFNGTIDLTSYPYPNFFNLPYINTSTFYSFELQIDAEAALEFWINGIPSDDAYNPEVYRDDSIDLIAFVHYGGAPVIDGEWVYFYDVTQDNLFIGSAQTIGGYAQVFYNTNWNTTAGPHLIYATWSNRYNYSYFIYDAPISINLDICPLPREINRTGGVGTEFAIHGYLNDINNGNPIKYGYIEVRLLDGGIPVSYLLNLESGSLQLGDTGEIDLAYSVSASSPAKNYTLEVWFNGIFSYTNPVYPQYFDISYLGNLTNFANGFFELKVLDPDNISIYFVINGNPTRSFYWDLQPPERVVRGDTITFNVLITQSGSPVTSGTVSIFDEFNSLLLDSYIYNGSEIPLGSHNFIINTATWHGGLHRIKVNWSTFATFNTTYVVLNESVSISRGIDKSVILRGIDSFTVTGTVQEFGVQLRALGVSLILLDSSLNDVSGFLIPPQTDITNIVGFYQFVTSVDITCPQGQYYIRIDFNGTIIAPGIDMSNFMINSNSSLIPINIIAGISLNGNYETKVVKDDWYFGDDCYVYGTLLWDNGTAMVGMEINVTIRNGLGGILATQTVVTDAFGFFNTTFVVGDWLDDTEVWVYFYPEDIDNFGIPGGLYILSVQKEFYRAP